MVTSVPDADAAPEEGRNQGVGRPTRPLFPSKWMCIAIVTMVALAVAMHFAVAHQDLFPIVDRAVVNLLTTAFGLIIALMLGMWFTFRSGYWWAARWGFACLALAGLIALVATVRIEYFSGDMVPHFVARWAPTSDSLPAIPSGERQRVDLSTTTPDDFPQFLGPGRDGMVPSVQISHDWATDGPRRIWRKDVGAGWSAFSAVNGFAVTMEQRGEDELISCYDLSTGDLRWWHAYQGRHQSLQGGVGPRGTPTIDAGRVYALGATGVLSCLDGATGQLQWSRDLLQEFGVGSASEDLRSVAWGRAASPLIVDQWVVVPAGGPSDGDKVSLVAYDKLTGEPAWQSGDQQISYSSPTLMTLDGVRQIVIVNESSVSGHAAGQDSQSNQYAVGEVLWQYEWPGGSTTNASTSQPVALPDDRVLLSKGYGGGAALIQVRRGDDGTFSVETIWQNTAVLKTKFANVVVDDGHLYALSDGILECVDLETGDRVWKRGRYGHGQILFVGESLLVLTESGDIVLVAATPDQHRELARASGIEGQTWNNLCLYGSHLLIRNSQEAACYRLPLRDFRNATSASISE